MDILSLVLRWLHVLSAVTMVGGVFYMRLAVLPATETLPEEQRGPFGGAMRRAWAKWVMISVALLLVTGLVNMIMTPKYNDFDTEQGKKLYSMLVGIKFVLALPVFFLISTLNGRSANADRFREKQGLWLNLAAALCILIICIAGFVRFIPRSAKPAAELRQPAQAAPLHPADG